MQDLMSRLKTDTTLNSLLEKVMHDVNDLFNTRLLRKNIENYHELKKSIFTYGLPSLPDYEQSIQTSNTLANIIKKALQLHEPRLTNIEVTANNPNHSKLNFSIHATLLNEPDPFEIKYDSSVDLEVQHFTLSKSVD